MTRYLSIIFFASFCATLFGQNSNIAFRANVPKPILHKGEEGVLILTVTGAEPDQPPARAFQATGLQLVFNGEDYEEKRNVDNNGVNSVGFYTYRYSVLAVEVGEHTIPPIKISVKGRPLRTKPIPIRVTEGESANVTPIGDRFAVIEVPDERIYVNEKFPAKVNIYVKGRRSINGLQSYDLTHESFVIKPFGTEKIAAEALKGEVYSIMTLPTTMFSLRSGDHRLGPGSFDVKLYDQNQLIFTGIIIPTIESNTVRINVEPLPSGAPASFTGGVGKFTIEGASSPGEVIVGDPVTLTFTVGGQGNFETMSAPVCSELGSSSWRTYEPRKQMLTSEKEGEKAVFTRVVIPTRQVDKIPSFAFSYFDPEQEKYVTLKTLEIPLTVSPDSLTTVVEKKAPVVSIPQESIAAEPAEKPMMEYPDILHIRPGMANFSSFEKSGSNWRLILTNGVLGIAIVGLMIRRFAGGVRDRKQRKSSADGPGSFKEALHQFRSGMTGSEFYHVALLAIERWREENQNAPENAKELIGKLEKKCEGKLYSVGDRTADGAIPSSEADPIIKALRKLPRY